jgi:hypothetical protein
MGARLADDGEKRVGQAVSPYTDVNGALKIEKGEKKSNAVT